MSVGMYRHNVVEVIGQPVVRRVTFYYTDKGIVQLLTDSSPTKEIQLFGSSSTWTCISPRILISTAMNSFCYCFDKKLHIFYMETPIFYTIFNIMKSVYISQSYISWKTCPPPSGRGTCFPWNIGLGFIKRYIKWLL